ncbi:hypothetical protein QAD02_003698, partial [Eretmocerus hayati]
TADNLTECRIICTMDHKDYYLYYFLKKHPGRSLVFCNSINCVKRLATLLGILGCNPLPLHACMPQRRRLKNLEKFQKNDCGLLIATDVAARGLDIPHIEHVLHYQVPRTSESYIHRSGRTARAQNKGITVLIMEPSEKQFYSRLCRTLNRTEDLPIFPVSDRLLMAVKERVDLARKIDCLELKCRRSNSQRGWLQKAAKDMDILLENEEFDSLDGEGNDIASKRFLKMKRNQLSNLMRRPVFPERFSGKYIDATADNSADQNPQNAIDVMERIISGCPKLSKESLVHAKEDSSLLKRRINENILTKEPKSRKIIPTN